MNFKIVFLYNIKYIIHIHNIWKIHELDYNW